MAKLAGLSLQAVGVLPKTFSGGVSTSPVLVMVESVGLVIVVVPFSLNSSIHDKTESKVNDRRLKLNIKRERVLGVFWTKTDQTKISVVFREVQNTP